MGACVSAFSTAHARLACPLFGCCAFELAALAGRRPCRYECAYRTLAPHTSDPEYLASSHGCARCAPFDGARRVCACRSKIVALAGCTFGHSTAEGKSVACAAGAGWRLRQAHQLQGAECVKHTAASRTATYRMAGGKGTVGSPLAFLRPLAPVPGIMQPREQEEAFGMHHANAQCPSKRFRLVALLSGRMGPTFQG